MSEQTDHAPLVSSAWAAFHRRDWDEAGRRWAQVREAFPGLLIGFSAAVTTLREARRPAEADALSTLMLQKFPAEPAAHIEHAWLVAARSTPAEAFVVWQNLVDRFPGQWVPFLGGARALRDTGNLAEAEIFLRSGIDAFPAELALLSEYANWAADRRDWPEAISRWTMIRDRQPDHLAAYTGGAMALRGIGRFAEAETLLREASAKFPADTSPLTELAWLSFIRNDFAESVARWDSVRDRFPNLVSGYTDAVKPLSQLNRFAEAEHLLVEAALRFPHDFAPAFELASLALRRRDWARANRLFAVLRIRFPDRVASYGGGIVALRELRLHADAERIAVAAAERFPNDPTLRIDMAWLAQSARDWKAASERWASVRRATPDFVDGYIQGARALAQNWQHDEAEEVLAEAMRLLPGAAEPAIEHAWIAMHQNRWDEAGSRFDIVRSRFPDKADGWRGGASVLKATFQFPAAEKLLEEAMTRFPDNPQFYLDHAQIPVAPAFAEQKDWPETLRRLDHLNAKFPDFEAGLLAGVRLLKNAGKPEQSEALAETATERLPNSYALAIQCAEAAAERQVLQLAIGRYTRIKDRFPELPGGEVGLARVLAENSRIDEAETLLRGTMTRFPTHPEPFAAFADIALRREDWTEAFVRWTDAVKRFPHEKDFAHRAYDAQMRMTEGDPTAAAALAQLAPAPIPDPDNADQQVRQLVMQFESLGGRGLGCEFGIFQRDCGAEPLGLLRWADMPYEGLLSALLNRFEGVGSEEHTVLFTTAIGGGRAEYCTRDKRDMMFMRTFVWEDQTPFERMKVSAFNRLRFLSRKLIDDLAQGSKIFVFRLTDRNLSGAEVDALHSAMRSYGDNTLLYVRYEDSSHPNGTVEVVKPGLLIGYMDRFKMARTGELSAAPPTASWLAVARQAYSLCQAQTLAHVGASRG
jgi:predicted Zn-dependent protease